MPEVAGCSLQAFADQGRFAAGSECCNTGHCDGVKIKAVDVLVVCSLICLAPTCCSDL